MASAVSRSVLCNAVFSRTKNQGSIRFSQEHRGAAWPRLIEPETLVEP